MGEGPFVLWPSSGDIAFAIGKIELRMTLPLAIPRPRISWRVYRAATTQVLIESPGSGCFVPSPHGQEALSVIVVVNLPPPGLMLIR